MTSDQKKTEKVSADLDYDIIRNYILSGMGAGGAAGLATSYFNHLANLRRQADLRTPKRMLDIARPEIAREEEKEDGEKSATWSRGIGLTGGLLGGLGIYGLIRQWSQAQRARDHAKRLEQAHSHYINMISKQDSEDKKKSAAAEGGTKPFDLYDALLGFGFATPLLLALAGGVGTYKFLDHQYPVAKDPDENTPQFKLRRRSPRLMGSTKATPTSDTPKEEEDEKKASICELMLHTIRGDEKRAAAGQWDVLFKAASLGYTDELKKGFQTGGIDGLFEKAESCVSGVKTASIPDDKAHLGIYWLSRDPVLAPTISMLAGSEHRDMNTEFHKAAAGLPEDIQNELLGLGHTCMTWIRSERLKEAVEAIPEDLVKSSYNITDLVSKSLQQSTPQQEDPGTQAPPAQQSSAKPQHASSKQTPPDKDPVDQFFG